MASHLKFKVPNKYWLLNRTAFTLVEALVVVVIIGILIVVLLPPAHPPREAKRRVECKKNISTIIQAINAYETKHGRLPAVIEDAEGKPLYSWRVAILPYLGDEGKDIQKQLRLDEPWDSEHNIAINAPSCFHCPSDGNNRSDRTMSNYALITDRQANADKSPYPVILEILPGVHWLQPKDLTMEDYNHGPPQRFLRSEAGFSEFRIGSYHIGIVNAGYSDGSIQYLKVPPPPPEQTPSEDHQPSDAPQSNEP